MQDIIKNDIKESLEWMREEYGKHGFDVSQPIQDMDVFFQAQEASMDTLNNEISDIADEYGEDSLEVEAAEELRDDVEEGFKEVGETTAESLKEEIQETKLINEEYEQIFQKKDGQYKDTLAQYKEEIENMKQQIEELKYPAKYRMKKALDKISVMTKSAKDFAEKTFDNVKGFCHDRKIDLFKAVDNARMKQNRFLKEFCLNTREMTMQSRNRNQEKLQACEDYLQKYQEAKKAKKAVINQFLKPFLPKKISEKYFSTDVNKIKFDERKDYNPYSLAYQVKYLRKQYISKIDNRQKFMDRLERTIDKLDEKAANIATKWQDKAKEPTQKSFEEKLNQFEKEAEMENQNIPPQRTQSQER